MVKSNAEDSSRREMVKVPKTEAQGTKKTDGLSLGEQERGHEERCQEAAGVNA